jgi:uncharacterized protein
MHGVGLPGYLQSPSGRLFSLMHQPSSAACTGLVLHIPPFAEELNTCRRVSAQTARAMAQAGWAVCQFDPSGCGDSEGELEDVRWSDWLDDAEAALRAGLNTANVAHDAPIWIWGVRSGALLAAQLLTRLKHTDRDQTAWCGAHPIHMLWWQPVLSGKQVLQLWLRLHSAQAWLGHRADPAPSPAERLSKGETVFVGGYPISAALAQDLQAATCPSPPEAPGSLVWLDTQATDAPTAGVERGLAPWSDAGWRTSWRAVSGPFFWQTMGQEDAPALVAASLHALSEPAT